MVLNLKNKFVCKSSKSVCTLTVAMIFTAQHLLAALFLQSVASECIRVNANDWLPHAWFSFIGQLTEHSKYSQTSIKRVTLGK